MKTLSLMFLPIGLKNNYITSNDFFHFKYSLITLFLFSVLSSSSSTRAKRPILSTPCCGCWSSTRPTWRTWSGKEQKSWRSRNRGQRSFWLRCFLRECFHTPARFSHTFDFSQVRHVPRSTFFLSQFKLLFNFHSVLWQKLWKPVPLWSQSTLIKSPSTSVTL